MRTPGVKATLAAPVVFVAGHGSGGCHSHNGPAFVFCGGNSTLGFVARMAAAVGFVAADNGMGVVIADMVGCVVVVAGGNFSLGTNACLAPGVILGREQCRIGFRFAFGSRLLSLSHDGVPC